jgi:hypothetical protein
MTTLARQFNGYFAFGFLAFLLTGCGDLPKDSFFRSDGWLATTYDGPAGDSAQLVVEAPARTSTPLFVELCSRGKWEKAAVLAPGWMRIDGMLFSEKNPDIAQNPKAVRLPDRAAVSIATDRIVKFRVRTQPEVVSGGYPGPWTTSTCTVTVSLVPKKDEKYLGTWHLGEKNCEINLVRLSPTPGKGSASTLNEMGTDSSC